MCGIAGIYLHDPNERPFTRRQMETLVDNLLLRIEHRGRHATGIAAVTSSGTLHLEKKDVDATKFVKNRRKLPRKPQSILLHTRWATQGEPSNMRNNHPIKYGRMVAIHNGHISNDSELFRTEGLSRNAEVDSEIIPALFNKHGLDKAHIPLQKLDGNYAVAVTDIHNPGSLVLAKGWTSPLFYAPFDEGIIWASTRWAIDNAIEKALGMRPSHDSIKELNLGKLLMIENGSIDELEFEPYYRYTAPSKPYRFTPKSNTCDVETDASKIANKVMGDVKLSEGEFIVSTADGLVVYRRCDECNISFAKTRMVNHGGWYFCDNCYIGPKESDEDGAYDWIDGIISGIYEEDQEESIEDILEREHEEVCEVVADEMGTTPAYVEWLVFEAEDSGEFDKKDGTTIKLLHERATELYDQWQAIFRDNNESFNSENVSL